MEEHIMMEKHNMMEKRIIEKIVKASGITAGELVLIHFWGESEEEEVLNDFMEAVVGIGASPIELRQSRSRNQKIFLQAKETSFDDRYFSLYKQVDTVLDIFTYQPVVLGSRLEEPQMTYYRNYMQQIFGALVSTKRFLQIRIPTEQNALESGLEVNDFMQRMNEAYDINYENLKSRCEARKSEYAAAKGIELHTGEASILNITFEGREWYVDSGDGDMPCGEIFVAPIEEKTNGEVFFEKLFVEDEGAFDNVVLYIKDGVVEHSNQAEVDLFLKKLETCDRTICELGFGMNENVSDLCGYTVLDEKMADTFHIAIGNNSMFGGKNQATIHMDFVGTADVILKY